MISLANTILHPPKLKCEAVIYGRTQEENAAKKFSEITGLDVLPCGLFIDKNYSYLAASPDGLVGQDALLEVKCPYTQRESKISTAPHLFPMLENKDGQLTLKTNHDHYYQIQGQLNICKKKFCYYVIYTSVDIHVEKIPVDCKFFAEKMLPQLTEFWDSHYLPCIVRDLTREKQS